MTRTEIRRYPASRARYHSGDHSGYETIAASTLDNGRREVTTLLPGDDEEVE